MRVRTRGFTLIELLVVIAIIVILVGLVLVSLRGVRGAAGRADSLGALRQIGVGFSLYTQDQNGQLLPGYIDASLFEQGKAFEELEPRLQGGTVPAIPDRQSYVWRLAPYLDDAWQTFFADMTDRGAYSRFQADYCLDADPTCQPVYGPSGGTSPNHDYTGNISERPSYGMNSIFVGGDSFHGGGDVVARHPWQSGNAKIAATRLSEARNPASLIIFAPAALALTGAPSGEAYNQPEAGFCELRPPFTLRDGDKWKGAQWLVGEGNRVETFPAGQYADGAGLPIDRRGGGKIPVVHLDGSANVEEIATLSRDMRRWNPFELALRETEP